MNLNIAKVANFIHDNMIGKSILFVNVEDVAPVFKASDYKTDSTTICGDASLPFSDKSVDTLVGDFRATEVDLEECARVARNRVIYKSNDNEWLIHKIDNTVRSVLSVSKGVEIQPMSLTDIYKKRGQAAFCALDTGFRCLIVKTGDNVKLEFVGDWTNRRKQFPDIADDLGRFGADITLDCWLSVEPDENIDTESVMKYIENKDNRVPNLFSIGDDDACRIHCTVLDILEIDGINLKKMTWLDRQEAIEEIFDVTDFEHIRKHEFNIAVDLDTAQAMSKEMDLAITLDSPYIEGDNPNWLEITHQ